MKTRSKQWFTSRRKDGNFQPQQLQENKVLPTSQPFTLRKINELSVNDFIRCYIENDLQVLIITGQPSQQELTDHYRSIITEYHDLVGSTQNKTMLAMQKKLQRIRQKITMVTLCTQQYLRKRDPELKQLLSQLGFRFEQSKSNKLIEKLLEAHVKNWLVDLQNAQQDIDNYISKQKSDVKASRKTFLENIVAMKKEGFHIHINETMLDEYAIAVRMYNDIIEAKLKAA